MAAWQLERADLEVRSDSVAALTMAMQMKVSGQGPGIIAQELAMVIGCATFRPNVFSHVPGLANVTADMLSRRFEPGVSFRLPALLAGVQETHAATRSAQWWRTMRPPPGAA